MLLNKRRMILMNLTYLEQLNQLISSNECFYKRKRIKVNKKKEMLLSVL